MSKRLLKKYLSELDKNALEEQIMDLYNRIPLVKTYYNFVFNPQEEKLVHEAKLKISNEYFPVRRKRPRKRRSIAQNYIKHFKTLGMDPKLLADVMLYNIEIAQTYNQDNPIKPEAFYKSMYKSFHEAVQYIVYHHMLDDYSKRLERIMDRIEEQEWVNQDAFDTVLERIVN